MEVIERQYTKFLFPFRYQQADPLLAKCRGAKGEWNVFEQFSQPAEGLREGLSLLLHQDGGSAKIADCFRLSDQSRKYFNLPKRKDQFLTFHCRQAENEQTYAVAITELRVFLFESGVGFLELECAYRNNRPEDYIICNYFIAEIKSDKNHFTTSVKEWDAATKTSTEQTFSFTVRELVNRVFDAIGLVSPSKSSPLFDSKPVIFSYLLLSENPRDLEDLLTHAAKNFKLSYKFSDETESVSRLKIFENSHWASTPKGVVNISHLTDDQITNNFFLNDFVQKTKTTYFTLFLHVLHQKYATLLLLAKMGQLDRLSMDYSVMKEELHQARLCNTEAQNLQFRAFFQIPSDQEHINRIYEQMYSTYRISDLQDNFKADMENLQGICDTYVQRINTREQNLKQCRSAKVEIYVAVFGTIVGEVALIDASLGIMEKLSGRTFDLFSLPMLLLILTLVLPLVMIAVDVAKRIADIRSLENELQSELDNHLVEESMAQASRKKTKRKNASKKAAKVQKKQ